MFSSTLVLPKNLLTPTTLAAGGSGFSFETGFALFSITLATWAIVRLPQTKQKTAKAAKSGAITKEASIVHSLTFSKPLGALGALAVQMERHQSTSSQSL